MRWRRRAAAAAAADVVGVFSSGPCGGAAAGLCRLAAAYCGRCESHTGALGALLKACFTLPSDAPTLAALYLAE
jgi:hypothetical protein